MDIASTTLELTGSDTRHRIPYKCPINVPRLQSGRNINARHRQTSSTIRTCMRHHSYPSYTSLTIVMLSARSRDPRFMASFVLTGGCVIVRKIFGGHEGDKGFYEMYVVGILRIGNSLKFHETFILKRSIFLLALERIFLKKYIS